MTTLKGIDRCDSLLGCRTAIKVLVVDACLVERFPHDAEMRSELAEDQSSMLLAAQFESWRMVQEGVVEKEVQGQRTLTRTRALTAKERATEVARMLSGVEESASATAHAAELLGLAAAARRVAG